MATELNLKARKRPSCRVSEEAYNYFIKLSPRFISEEELPELTVESISGYQERMNDDPPAHVSPDGHDRDADPNDTVSAPNTRGA
ncbi:hypothetical protein EN45_052650 [Penicillium chrysogenum]|jgi:hypothetical protein|uniref:Uncharacterized protein n=1 Tax=Penicillium chrysogenum TaxID=5076 RepID=A0A167S2Y6_PENCH|nr:uncharacterized protein N7525_009410 [Penicillium rubens]KAJ5831157.1 hypothetical protein N7525_009410 [Penicillium rubens]KAJ5854705.1 hypothetical protein N7534_007248 [Penicillium rubens]KZN86721.1 hypothetical protein EN45_052650 [Penicillium chrysogenum]